MEENVLLLKTRRFALLILNLGRSLRKIREYEIASQIIRSGTSIGANVNESVRAQSRRDFYTKLCIASKEAQETSYWLQLIEDSGFDLSKEPYKENLEEIIKILVATTKKIKMSLSL